MKGDVMIADITNKGQDGDGWGHAVRICPPHRLGPESCLQALYGFVPLFFILLFQSKECLSLLNKTSIIIINRQDKI